MSSPPGASCESSAAHPKFRFDLRTMLLLTALVAWLFAWGGADVIWTLLILAGLAMIEAGCARGGNVMRVLVRNLSAYFVCSLTFGAVGFGLMRGHNPTGWFGTDLFLFNPFPFAHKTMILWERPEYDREAYALAIVEAGYLRDLLRHFTSQCTVAAVIAHRVMAGRCTRTAYVLFWVAMAALVYPLLGAWSGVGWMEHDAGWFTWFGFHPSTAFLTAAVSGSVALAGSLVMGSRSGGDHRRLSLLSSHCHYPLVISGVALLWICWAIVPSIRLILAYVGDPARYTAAGWTIYIAVTPIIAVVAGVAGAVVGGFLVFRKFHPPLTVSGGLGGSIAYLAGSDSILPLWTALSAFIAGLLVIAASSILDRLRVDDPGGAVAVHGFCAAWGALSLGLFVKDTFSLERPLPQLLGVAACLFSSLALGSGVFWLIRRTIQERE